MLYEKSGAILQVLMGLTAGWQSAKQSDKILVDLKIFKNSLWIALLQSLTKAQYYYSVTNGFQSVFQVKHIVRRVIE